MRAVKAQTACEGPGGLLPRIGALLACSLALSLSAVVAVRAETPVALHTPAAEPTLLSAPGLSMGMPQIYGITRPLAPHWNASYGLGLAEETALSPGFLRFEQEFAASEPSAGNSRDNWRHFLGLEFTPTTGFSFLGGIAAAGGINGKKSAGLYPTGYERLRLNAGARWSLESWGVDGSFSFIPTGANRVPADAGYFPDMGGSGPTWLFALTLSRRF